MQPASEARASMQQNNDNRLTDQHPRSPFDGSLSDYMEIILRYRKFIGYLVGVTFFLSIIVSLLLPKMYIATVRILPPRENSSGLSSLLARADGPLSGLAGNLVGSKTPAALYVGILNSRSVAEGLNKKFNLKELYDLKYIEDVYLKLADRSTIEISKKDQIISVSVNDRDPQRAADMANAYADMLDQINRKLNITQGKRKRIFLEDRLKKVRADLEKAEMDLKDFQEQHHLVSIEEQAKVAIEGAAEIKGQIIAAETELEVFKQFGTERQIEAVKLNAKIEELQKQLDIFEQGDKSNTGSSKPSKKGEGSNFYIPFGELPRLGLQLMRLTREAKIQGKLFELLTAQFEMAQIEEAKDMDTIQVLDRAVPPEKKISPNRSRIVITATILMFFIAAIIVIRKEYQ
jgi:tyrosine-protein kinase Etk/Wzc